jgi:1-acyl-sn-glycerol-3-phosphate acyltransferase
MLRDTLLWIRSIFFSTPVVILITVAATLLALVAVPSPRAVHAIRRRWAQLLLAAAFVRIVSERCGAGPSTNGCIICCNHLSYLDPPVISAVFDRPLTFIAKRSLFSVPFLGWGMRIAGDIVLDRDNPRAAMRSLKEAAAAVQAGKSLVIFPEGGRSPDGTLQPFFSGAFRMAVEAQAAVIPVAIDGTREALRPGSLLLRGGSVRVAVGKPINTQGLTKANQNQLSNQVESTIRSLGMRLREKR